MTETLYVWVHAAKYTLAKKVCFHTTESFSSFMQ